MGVVKFNFSSSDAWTMGPACGSANKPSINPAPSTHPCIYIIHNSITNSTYVGYADDAQDRWSTRYEVFHTFGIAKADAKKILCACCIPTVSKGVVMNLKGGNNCEHLLIRAVVQGALGVTTNTNTQLASTPFFHASVDRLEVSLPAPNKWGNLLSDRYCDLNNNVL